MWVAQINWTYIGHRALHACQASRIYALDGHWGASVSDLSQGSPVKVAINLPFICIGQGCHVRPNSSVKLKENVLPVKGLTDALVQYVESQCWALKVLLITNS